MIWLYNQSLNIHQHFYVGFLNITIYAIRYYEKHYSNCQGPYLFAVNSHERLLRPLNRPLMNNASGPFPDLIVKTHVNPCKNPVRPLVDPHKTLARTLCPETDTPTPNFKPCSKPEAPKQELYHTSNEKDPQTPNTEPQTLNLNPSRPSLYGLSAEPLGRSHVRAVGQLRLFLWPGPKCEDVEFLGFKVLLL